ncbi:MAG: iron uptake transporter permease EfeU [Dehalococcoidia bacterium]
MGASFLITLREGLEAALIISIVLAYLVRLQRQDQARKVWVGAGSAIVASLAVGALIFWTFGELSGRAEEIFEGTAMLLAVGVLSYMVLWMKRQARDIKANLEAQVKAALMVGSGVTLGSLAFIVVIREGVETVLFLFGASRAASPMDVAVGGIAGLVLAVVIGYMGYQGSRRMNLSTFFNVTGTLLIVFAAGLLAHGIHEFQEAGLFPIVIEHVWDINNILNEKMGLGSFMKALFGYNGNPALIEVMAYMAYMGIALWTFFRPEGGGREPLAVPVS